jgi:NDP-sugar pyrophosphorylase family protein
MILAAGLGSRLFPLTIDRTKPAVPFLGRPLVGYVAEYLASNGFSDIVVNLHHQAESVREGLKDSSALGVDIKFSEEFPSIMGTGGAFKHAKELLGNESFLAINGKIITDIDLRPIVDEHQRRGSLATMVVLPNEANDRFTRIETVGGRLTGFGPFPNPGDVDSVLWTGIHILSPEVFDYIPDGEQDIISCFYRVALREGRDIAVHLADGLWNEMSTIERYLDASISHLGDVDYHIGTGCEVHESSRLSQAILWDRVVVEADCMLKRVVVTDDVTLPSGSRYENCAIVSAERIRLNGTPPDKAPQGFIDGELYIVPLESPNE